MISILLVIHVLLSLAIIGLVLLQRGKGAEAGAALGGGGASGSVFGARGAANFLSRSTAVLATTFFVTSLGLAYLSSNQQSATVETGSVLEQSAEMPAAADVPAATDIPAPADAPVSDVPAAE